MRKVLAIIVAGLLLAAAVPMPAAAEADIVQLVKEVEPAVLFIVMFDKNGEQYGLGSGFFISPEGEFLTNRHVLRDAFSAVAISPNGKAYPVTQVVAIHPEADLVKATVGNLPGPVPYLRISREGVVKGQHIFVFGNPQGLSFTVSDGLVSAFRTLPRFGDVFQMTAPISGGSSGGPVVNASGEVVGISVAGADEGQNLNFAVQARAIGGLVTPSGGPLVLNQPGEGQGQRQQAAAPKRPGSANKRFLFIGSFPEYDSYIDLGTITIVHNRDTDSYRMECWVKNVYNQTGKAKMIEFKTKEGQGERYYNFRSILVQLRVRPATNKFTFLQIVYYDDYGRIIENYEYQQPPEDTIKPGSQIDKVMALIARIAKENPNLINKVNE